MAQTKQERRQEIIDEVAKIESEQNFILELIKHNAWIVFISGESIRQNNKEVMVRVHQLQEELIAKLKNLSMDQNTSKKQKRVLRILNRADKNEQLK